MPISLRARVFLTVAAALLLLGATLGPAAAHPGHQHGSDEDHLIGSGAFGNIELVASLRLTDIQNTVADVAVSPDGNWAFVANWGRPTCAANSEKGGRTLPDAGAWVVNISDVSAPVLTGFIPHHQDTRPGEGMQVLELTTSMYSGTVLVMNSEQCGKNGKGGVVLWDVTNPEKPMRLSAHFGDRGFADTNDIHSAFAWDAGDQAYVVIVDNLETSDVDILDITNPRRPRLVREYNMNTFVPGGVSQPELGLDESFLHDMTVKQIGGRYILLLSYWDGGWVFLDVTDPANAVYLGDTDYPAVDPLLLERTGIVLPPEGNAHQAEWTADNRFFIGTDEDFSPYRAVFSIDTGPNAGEFFAGEFGWTVPLVNLPDGKLNGPTVYGGYGCPQDRSQIPAATQALPTVGAGEERILVLQRGPVGDPAAPFEACFFSEKVEAAQLAGYDGVVIANHHSGAQAGLTPDAHLCGAQGHVFQLQIPGICIGHRAMHLIFNTMPAYNLPYVAASEPAVGMLGERVTASPRFDGWGHVRLYDAQTLQELDAFAVLEAHDPAFASGFGDLTVHEVATHPTDPRAAYLSYYGAGLRAIEIQCANPASTSTCELVETGGYLDRAGNDFWGVETFIRDGNTYILGSDMDHGLWIFRDTARSGG